MECGRRSRAGKGGSANVLTIVGKRSSVVRRLGATGVLSEPRFRQLSHREALDTREILNPIVFAYARDAEDNVRFVKELAAKTVGVFSLVSSIVCACPAYCNVYRYVRTKREAEQAVADSGVPFRILRLGIVVDNGDELASYVGMIPVTRISALCDAIRYIDSIAVGSTVSLVEWELGGGSAILRYCHACYAVLARRAGRFLPWMRPIDGIFRLLGYRQYGYTHLICSR